MATTPAQVILLAPELASQTEDRINFFISAAALYINTSIWGAKADFAHALYTAHLMTIANIGGVSGSSGASGTVTSEKVGDLSRTYSDTSSTSGSNSTNSELMGTGYGRQFLAQRRSLLISPIVVN